MEPSHPDTVEAVLGVDTHRDFHVAAVLAMSGRTLGIGRFPAAESGYRQLHAWAAQLGIIRRAGVESSGNYGAALSRYLLSQGLEVLEAPGPGRAARRRRSKSDRSDAEAAARAVLSGRAHSPVKSRSGPAEIARLYLVAKDSAVKAQRQARTSSRPSWSPPTRPCGRTWPRCPAVRLSAPAWN